MQIHQKIAKKFAVSPSKDNKTFFIKELCSNIATFRCLVSKREVKIMLKLKVSKQTRSQASKKKVSNNQNIMKHINKLSKSK